MVIGVDEAGRGPVLGPLVVAAVDIDPEVLEGTDIKDSKLMTRNMRAQAFEMIRGHSSYCILELPAGSIDGLREKYSMNEIEVLAFSKVIGSLIAGKEITPDGMNAEHEFHIWINGPRSKKAILDAADVDAERFGRSIHKNLEEMDIRDIDIISEHKADLNYKVVGAASVLAKVSRDRRIEDLAQIAGEEIGSGYPSDPRTKEFLREYVLSKGKLPPFARASWETSKKLLRIMGQSRLMDF